MNNPQASASTTNPVSTTKPPATDTDIAVELLRSTRTIENHLQLLSNHPLLVNPPSRVNELLFHFSKGVAFGLGSVLGAGVVVSLVVYVLAQIQFVPIIGDLIKQILVQIQH